MRAICGRCSVIELLPAACGFSVAMGHVIDGPAGVDMTTECYEDLAESHGLG